MSRLKVAASAIRQRNIILHDFLGSFNDVKRILEQGPFAQKGNCRFSILVLFFMVSIGRVLLLCNYNKSNKSLRVKGRKINIGKSDLKQTGTR